MKLYRRAVELGDVIAMLNLGNMYEIGAGIKLDKEKARRLYRMGADRGDAKAQFNLARLLLQESDESQEAFELFKLSAALGFTDAIYMIGWCYLHGTGVALDRAEAKRWYQRAAAKGDQMAVKVLEVLARDTTGT